MGTKKDQDRPIITKHQEGFNLTRKPDGTVHETKYYDNGLRGSQASSSRSSQDIAPSGKTSDEHSKVQKK